MANLSFEIVLSINPVLATQDFLSFVSPVNGTIKEIHLKTTGAANTNGDNIFNLAKNGTNLYSGGSRPKIANGATLGSKTGLSDAVSLGDILTPKLESMATGGINENLILIVVIDDGISSGGGGGAYGVDIPPTSPNPENDEFDGPTLDPKWTQTTTGTAPATSLTDIQSYFLAKFGNADGLVRLTQSFTPGGADFSLTGKFSVGGQTNYQGVGMKIRNSDASEQVYIQFIPSYEQLRFYRDSNVSIQTVGIPVYTNQIFFHIERISNVYTAYFSFDGIAWTTLTSTITKSFTVADIQLEFFQSNATTKNRLACDWIRRDWFFF